MSKEQFASLMKTLGIAFNREITPELLQVYYEILKEENYETLKKAISEEIKTQKFFPSVSELLEECKRQKVKNGFTILEYMKQMGYFKISTEYDKACRWLDEGIIPHWFKEDMRKYAKLFNNKQVTNNNKNLLEKGE